MPETQFTLDSFLGIQRAKVFFAPPILILGSSNWPVASEASRELSCILQATQSAVTEVAAPLRDLSEGAKEVDLAETTGYALKKMMSQRR